MENSVQTPSTSRAQLAKGVLKALFTTSPKDETEVVVDSTGSVELIKKTEPESQSASTN